MTPDQQAVKNQAPASYHGTLERAYSGRSKAAGIKAFCLQCVGFLRNEVRDCSARGCPLHPYRPYQQGRDRERDDLPCDNEITRTEHATSIG